tara:strand:+ start:1565 stop:1978 length:414 start_codon:yes stop_codon:yes gene_type:complete
MIRLWDFFCGSCNKSYRDWPCEGKIPQTIECKCGKQAEWGRQKTNHIHRSHSSMYGKYEPGLGQVVESYEHKRQLMKEMDLQESSDPSGGSRSYRPEEQPARASKNNSQFLDAAELESAQAEALTRAAQGDFDLEAP